MYHYQSPSIRSHTRFEGRHLMWLRHGAPLYGGARRISNGNRPTVPSSISFRPRTISCIPGDIFGCRTERVTSVSISRGSPSTTRMPTSCNCLRSAIVTSQRIASICGQREWSSRSATSFRAQATAFALRLRAVTQTRDRCPTCRQFLRDDARSAVKTQNNHR